MRRDPRVTLVVAPWASTTRPSLAAGILQASARREGVACATRYLNVDFAATFGVAPFEIVAGDPELFGLAEHLFATDLFGRDALDSTAFLRECADRRFGGGGLRFRSDTLHALRDIVVPATLRRWSAELLADDPDVVGFTCVFNQVMPSLALARRLKVARPELVVLFGGACVHGAMGEAYAGAFADTIDHVFTGEADVVFPRWLHAFASGDRDVELPGVTRGGRLTEAPVLVTSLDRIPTPCYDDFVAVRDRMRAQGLPLADFTAVPFEAARGCWWGAKHHCTFCGLNNEGMTFRRKSPARVVDEVRELRVRTGVARFAAADNILASDGYTTLLPRLEALDDVRFFFEIKANVRRDDVVALRRAGVDAVQPGIESFADPVLALMRKGVTAAQNVALLKWLAEHGIDATYNILVGFPGETDDDYERMLALLPALSHLPAPSLGQAIPVAVHRFAPFHAAAESLGIRNVRPARAYRHLIPPAVLDPASYAYYFDHDLPPDAPLPRHRYRLDAAIGAWARSTRRVRAELAPGAVRIHHGDAGASSTRELSRDAGLVLLLCDAPTSDGKLARVLEERAPAVAQRLPAVLAELLDDGLVVRAGERVVGCVPMITPCTSADLARWMESA